MLASMFKGGCRYAFAALAGSCLIATISRATTIDFNGLPGADGSPFTGYTQAGFAVAPLSSNWLVGQNFGNPPPFIFFEHPAVANTTTTAAIRITDAGATFSFSAIDIYSSVTPVPYIFVGSLSGTTVFTTAGTVPLPFGNFITVSNPNGADLIDALEVTLSTFTQFPVGNRVGVDNIVVNSASSSVAEPASLLLLLSALGVVALVRRRSSGSVKS
jgi:hypothetical protein